MIKSLKHTDKKVIVDVLHEAFSDYAIPMKMPHNYWYDRWEMANISYEDSFGLFQGENLVGFVLHGIDQWHGDHCVYNMATGIIPAFRGQAMVSQIYTHCLPLLKAKNIHHGYLEVLTNNTKAIKAYQKSGFKIVDEMHSYHIPDNLPLSKEFTLNTENKFDYERFNKFQHHQLSFEHRDVVILRNQEAFDYHEMMHNDITYAYAVSKKSNGNIVQFGCLDNNIERYASELFALLKKNIDNPRIINISIYDEKWIEYFKSLQFPIFISQYSMKLAIPGN